MRKYLSLLVVLAFLCLTGSAVAEGEVTFHDAKTKFYNDNGFPKLLPETPLILETTFSVDEKKDIYFILEHSDDNMPYIDSSQWRVRLRLLNDTWSFTDLGQFGDGAPLTAPTNPFTVVPGHNYTLQMSVTFREDRVTIAEAYEISVVMGVKSEGSYNPSDSITHIVQFSEDPVVIETPSEPFPWSWVVAMVMLVAAFVIYGIHRKRRKDEKEH